MNDKDLKRCIDIVLKDIKSINDFIVYTINIKNKSGHDINLWDDDIYKIYNGVKDELLHKTGLTNAELTLVMLSRQFNFNILWYAIKLEELRKELNRDIENSRATQIARELVQGEETK